LTISISVIRESSATRHVAGVAAEAGFGHFRFASEIRFETPRDMKVGVRLRKIGTQDDGLA
jgi:hypothetical protein